MDLTALTDEELVQLHNDAYAEQERRRNLAMIPAAIDTLNQTYLTAEGIEPGQEWRQPLGAHDSYPKDWEVTRNGKTWASDVASNVWEPGVANWREVVPEGAPPPEWVQPTGSTDAYNTGDRVTFEGVAYTSTMDANVWSPADFPQGWQADV